MTIITANKDDHQSALIEVDIACRSLGLYLKPSKCISITVHKGSVLPNATFQLSDGQTKNISNSPTTFLGITIASNTRHTNREASRILRKDITNKLSEVDARSIRGEIKLWILRSLIIPSIHFHLVVNTVLATTISFLENSIAKPIKQVIRVKNSWGCRPRTRITWAYFLGSEEPSLKFLHLSKFKCPNSSPISNSWRLKSATFLIYINSLLRLCIGSHIVYIYFTYWKSK